MVAAAQKIILSGYYGFRNSGDEAVLQSILDALQKHSQAAGIPVEPVVLSIDPEWTTATYGVKAVHRMKLGEVQPGHLRECRSHQRRRKPAAGRDGQQEYSLLLWGL